MTDCNGCGGCCDPVALTYSRLDAQLGNVPDPELARFILEDLTPLPRKAGLARASYMTEGITHMQDNLTGEPVLLFTTFFTCRWYNAAERRCENYLGRPKVCAGYPWYGGPPDRTKTLPEECSFRADIGQPVTIRTGVQPRS